MGAQRYNAIFLVPAGSPLEAFSNSLRLILSSSCFHSRWQPLKAAGLTRLTQLTMISLFILFMTGNREEINGKEEGLKEE